MHPKAEADRNGSTTNAADYIHAHLAELIRLARQEDLLMLVYLLEMAQIEAMEVANEIRPGLSGSRSGPTG